ncbi:MAG: hypothetical protein AMJ59_07105 [Gammaproteobacteria bacterium SG8_31]|nr:MAG: hypothetical protein AMJ59_07105 [Gammaproteobacteria bacterium SG8_31]
MHPKTAPSGLDEGFRRDTRLQKVKTMEEGATVPTDCFHDGRRADPDQIRYALVVLAAWSAVLLAVFLL